jgi:hypothetical protein
MKIFLNLFWFILFVFCINTSQAQFSLLKDIGLDAESGVVTSIIQDEYSNGFYIVLNKNLNLNDDQLWYSDGTAQGTILLKSVGGLAWIDVAKSEEDRRYGFANGYFFFEAFNNSTSKYELWVSKATIASFYCKDL